MITCSEGIAQKMRVDSDFDTWCKWCLRAHFNGCNKIVSLWSIDHNEIIITSSKTKTEIKFVWEI